MSKKVIKIIPAIAGWWFKNKHNSYYHPVIAWEISNDGVVDVYYPVYPEYSYRDNFSADKEYKKYGSLIYNPTQIFTLVEDGLGDTYQPLSVNEGNK
ncbi:hypothetical protein FE394_06200 [Xenorhabdus sp. Reich]|uniref:Uncharacterized protein n=1 Tax=Xenorhabdus littoralis TaxID=2582835 RepID=A0ABU4SJG8_9GAMM|nr:hypothetical protein [Xenorhabdus sp. Reich]MDX7998792.1 hypothetical protein [Xenorhabdus sp. Reich]